MMELGIAIDGGKDSLSMAARVPKPGGGSETAKAPGELVVTCYAPVPDVTRKVTPDLKRPGDSVLLFLDLEAAAVPSLGGTALAQVLRQTTLEGGASEVDGKSLKAAFEGTQRLLDLDLITAGHDRSDGGLLVCALEMAFAGNCGLNLRLPKSC